MHGPLQGPTGQEIDIVALEFSGTRSAEHESHATFFHESVNLVQQVRKTLHLVHHYPATGVDGAQLGRKQTGFCEQGMIGRLGEQIHEMGIGEFGSQPGTLARSARTEKEETLLWSSQLATKHFDPHDVNIR
jgi:hypothetical protein